MMYILFFNFNAQHPTACKNHSFELSRSKTIFFNRENILPLFKAFKAEQEMASKYLFVFCNKRI